MSRLSNRKSSIKKLYGIPYEQYVKMLVAQNFRCKICGQRESSINPITEETAYLQVDHSHETGEIRGLLCSACNKTLGFSRDNITILENAIKYLKENN